MNYTEPFVPTPEDIIPKMLTLASVMPGEMVFDLGSGDGRMVIAAAKDFHARVVGVEVRRRLVGECRRRVKEMGLSHQVVISCRNFKRVSLRKADVLAMYLSSNILNLMAPRAHTHTPRRKLSRPSPFGGTPSARTSFSSPSARYALRESRC
jgi:16S rRNA A1518/A1519 N6-dimethyltransferase RsmA/KsgA/DIM1 with predicted DNA glycosylase/AP lyase activity